MVDFSQRAASVATRTVGQMLSDMMDSAIAQKAKAEYAAGRGSGAGEVAAKRIGSGYIGTECDRELGFRYHKFLKEERPPEDVKVNAGELHRHGQAGHWTEKKTGEWLRLIGVDLKTDTGRLNTFGEPEQIGWKAARDPETGQFRMAGEVDGVILGFAPTLYTVPEALYQLSTLIKIPCIWESKKATDKKWKKFSKEGVKGADPKYYGQLQTNMAYLGATQTLFSMLNLDNMKYHWELIAFDERKAQSLSDRAVGVINTTSPFDLPRLGKSDDDFKCKYCDYHGQCWRGLVIPTPELLAKATEATIAGVAAHVGMALPARPLFNPNFKVT